MMRLYPGTKFSIGPAIENGFYYDFDLEEPLSTEQYAIGFKKGNEELRDQVQATLDEMAEDGTLAEIAAKYKDYNLDQMLCLGK